MSEIATEMRDAITFLGGDRSWSDTRKRWLERASRAAGISYRSAYSLFYQQGHEPRASTVEAIRRAVAAKTKQEAERADTDQVLARLAFLEDRLAALDPDFHREPKEAFRQTASRSGR